MVLNERECLPQNDSGRENRSECLFSRPGFSKKALGRPGGLRY